MKKKWPLVAGICILALSVGFYITWGKGQKSKNEGAAQNVGMDVKTYDDLEGILNRVGQHQVTATDMGKLLEYSKDENPSIRLRAFRALSKCGDEPFRGQAIQAIQAMKSDPDQSIKDQYAWALYKLQAPGWEEEWKKHLNSSDPQLKSQAERLVGP